jgi:hypothetical protein
MEGQLVNKSGNKQADMPIKKKKKQRKMNGGQHICLVFGRFPIQIHSFFPQLFQANATLLP